MWQKQGEQGGFISDKPISKEEMCESTSSMPPVLRRASTGRRELSLIQVALLLNCLLSPP